MLGRYGRQMPAKDEHAARKGKAAEQLIAALCVLATGTELDRSRRLDLRRELHQELEHYGLGKLEVVDPL